VRIRSGQVIVGIFVLLIVGGVVFWRFAVSAPSWYHPPARDDVAAQRLAEQTEYDLVVAFQQVRDEAPWTCTISEDALNAWLASRLPAWIARERGVSLTTAWPDTVGTPQVRVTEEGIDVAVPVEFRGAMRTLVARVRPQVTDEGASFEITGLGVGRLRISTEFVPELAQASREKGMGVSEEDASSSAAFSVDRWVRAIVEGGRTGTTIELADARCVTIQSLTLGEGTLTLSNRTSQARRGPLPSTAQEAAATPRATGESPQK